MQERARLEGMATIVPTPQMAKAVAFYADTLAFDLVYRMEDSYALMARGAAGIMLLGSEQGQRLAEEARNIAAYVWVDDLERYYGEISDKLAFLDDSRWNAPYARPNGMREFFVMDEDGTRIFFGNNTV